jgi:hypothetical protein
MNRVCKRHGVENFQIKQSLRGSLKVAPITEKLKGSRLSWYGHVMRREENHVTRRLEE